ncbi:MAG: hypothetical protein Q9218_004229 [Villophora microphyllina]
MRVLTSVRSFHMEVSLLLVFPIIFLPAYLSSSSIVPKHGQSPERRSSVDITAPTVFLNGTRNIGLAFGEPDHRPIFSTPESYLTKRLDPSTEVASELYVYAICNGTNMLAAIKEGYLAVPAGVQDFDRTGINNGWSMQDSSYKDNKLLEKRWDNLFDRTFQRQKPSAGENSRKGGKQGRVVTLE